eukprot:scaffold3396_cov268-Ochromonas_danica.AAC.2
MVISEISYFLDGEGLPADVLAAVIRVIVGAVGVTTVTFVWRKAPSRTSPLRTGNQARSTSSWGFLTAAYLMVSSDAVRTCVDDEYGTLDCYCPRCSGVSKSTLLRALIQVLVWSTMVHDDAFLRSGSYSYSKGFGIMFPTADLLVKCGRWLAQVCLLQYWRRVLESNRLATIFLVVLMHSSYTSHHPLMKSPQESQQGALLFPSQSPRWQCSSPRSSATSSYGDRILPFSVEGEKRSEGNQQQLLVIIISCSFYIVGSATFFVICC